MASVGAAGTGTQTGFDEKGTELAIIDDAEILSAVQSKYEKAQEYTDEAKELKRNYDKAGKVLNELLKDRKIKQGIYRAGEHMLEVIEREGGGTETTVWTTTMGRVKPLIA